MILENTKSTVRHLLNVANIYRLFGRFSINQATIFMLHRFHDPEIGYLTPRVSAELLERCLAYIEKNNYSILSISDLIQAVINKEKLYKTVCFTIDDGYIDFKNVAYPLFKKFEVPATVFITTDFIDGTLMMWWDQVEYIFTNTNIKKLKFGSNFNATTFSLTSLKEKQHVKSIICDKIKSLSFEEILISVRNLSKHLEVAIPSRPPRCYSALTWDDINEMEKNKIDFQPHTVNHSILSRISSVEQTFQITGSVDRIRQKINTKPTVYCYPNGLSGDFSNETISILQKEKFLGACIADGGFFDIINQHDLFRIPRIPFPRDFDDFVQYVSGYKVFTHAMKSHFIRLMKIRK